MTASVRSIEELAAALPPSGPIAIDGLTGSGKTWVAHELAAGTGRSLVSLDEYVRYGAAPYPEMLDLRRIAHLLNADPMCIVEGILLLDVLGRLHLQPALHVYVRRWEAPGKLSSPEYWELSPQDVIAQEEDLCRLIGANEDEPILGRELAYYHERFRPFEAAGLVYENLPS